MKPRNEILPQNFQAHYKKILGDSESEKFFSASLRPLKKCFRVNPQKYSLSECKKDAQEKNWTLTPVPWCAEGFFLEREKDDRLPLGTDIVHIAGGMYIQEASSMIPVEALLFDEKNKNFEEKIFLDIASAPGSKTTQLASKMNGQGILIANELSASRLKALHSNIQRCGVSQVLLTHYEGANLCSLLPEMVDKILLDAPCTGEGTVRKNYDALKNWKPEDAKRMGLIQKKLLLSAFQALKPGGEMIYSTCTLAKEENSEVVQYLQEKFPDSVEIISLEKLFPGAEKATTPEGFLQVWPHIFDTEGFFVAKIKKRMKNEKLKMKNSQAGNYKNIRNSTIRKFPFEKISRRLTTEVENFFNEKWGFTLPKYSELWKRGNEIWMFPCGSEEIFSRVKCDRIGIPLLTMHSKEWRTSYEIGICFGEKFSKNTISVEHNDLEKIFSGADIFLEKISMKSEKLLKYKNFPLAIGKGFENGKWKNALPRTVVRGGVR